MYKCPYCNQDTYARTSKNKGKFNNWLQVRSHTKTCKANNKTYFIDENEGPIYYTELLATRRELYNRFPNLKASIKDIKKVVKNKLGIELPLFQTKDSIIKAIQKWVHIYGKIPTSKEWYKNIEWPANRTVIDLFDTWNNAIAEAGFEPNIQNGFGMITKALDGKYYRSSYEAEFVNKFLFDKFEYSYELPYENHNKFYDFYIPKLDLYIELDGGIRPETTKEKIEINQKLNRKLLLVKPNDLYKYNKLEEFYCGV